MEVSIGMPSEEVQVTHSTKAIDIEERVYDKCLEDMIQDPDEWITQQQKRSVHNFMWLFLLVYRSCTKIFA